MKKIDKTIFKMSDEELQSWLAVRKRGSIVANKKGKGSYKRNEKHRQSRVA